jgi:hypothetical protein
MATDIDPEDNRDIIMLMIDELVYAACPKPTREQYADIEKRIDAIRYYLGGALSVTDVAPDQTAPEPKRRQPSRPSHTCEGC